MKFIRIFLLCIIIIGVGLLATQKLWLPGLDNTILRYEGFDPVAQVPKATITNVEIISPNTALRIKRNLTCDDVNGTAIGKPYVLNVGKGAPDFTFTFYTTPNDSNNSQTYISCIDVRQNNVLVEKIDQGIDSIYTQFPSKAIKVTDINSDGYNDIGFVFNEGMAPNYGQVDWYTYNLKTGKFVFYREGSGY